MVDQMSFPRRWSSLLFVAAVLVPVTLFQPYRNGPPIRSDGEGYHVWTRLLLEGDLSFQRYEKVQGIFRMHPSGDRYANAYPPGLALLRFPVMAFLVQCGPNAPLFSAAEHWANLVLSALALVAVCWLCLRTCALLAIDVSASHCAVLALVFGTGLFHYATYDGCFTHIYSALGAALLMWLGVRAAVRGHDRPSQLATGLTGFFLLLIRNTNVILIGALAVAYVCWRKRQTGTRIAESLQGLAGLLAGTTTAAAVQLAINWYYLGQPVLSSYPGQLFQWQRPMQGPVLFSCERGLFSYYPVVAVALAAAWLIRRTRPAACWFSLLVLAYATLYGFWYSWMLGGGFGHRGFVELMPLALVLFAAALGDMTPRWRQAVGVAGLAATVVTVHFMVAYWRGGLPCQDVPATRYWTYCLRGVGLGAFAAMTALAVPLRADKRGSQPRSSASEALRSEDEAKRYIP
jgi:hypothetical protein